VHLGVGMSRSLIALLFGQLDIFTFLRWVTLEPFRAQSIDENRSSGRCYTDGKNGHCEHGLTPVLPLLVLDFALLNLSHGDPAKGSLDRGFRNPSESHESTLLVVVLLLQAGDEGANPPEGYADQDDANTQTQEFSINLPDYDTGAN